MGRGLNREKREVMLMLKFYSLVVLSMHGPELSFNPMEKDIPENQQILGQKSEFSLNNIHHLLLHLSVSLNYFLYRIVL